MQVKDIIDRERKLMAGLSGEENACGIREDLNKRILAAQKAEEDLANRYRAVEESLASMFTPGDKFTSFIENVRGEAETREESVKRLLDSCQAGMKEINRLSNAMLTPGVDFEVPAIGYPRKQSGVSITIKKLIINVGDPQPKNGKGE